MVTYEQKKEVKSCLDTMFEIFVVNIPPDKKKECEVDAFLQAMSRAQEILGDMSETPSGLESPTGRKPASPAEKESHDA